MMPGATDRGVISVALRDQRVLLTEDKDFGRLFRASAPAIGVIILRYAFRSHDLLCKTLVALIEQRGESLQRGLAIVEPGRSRIVG